MKFTFFSFNKKSVLKQLLEDLSYMVTCSFSVLEKIRIMSKYTEDETVEKVPEYIINQRLEDVSPNGITRYSK